MDFIKDLEIDEHNLDNAIIKQPVIAMQYQEELAKKGREKDDLKLEIEVLESEIDRHIRDTYTKKPTETEIKNMIISDPERIKLIKEYNAINEEYNILRGAVNSFEHRKKALEKLVDLHIMGYASNVKQNTKETVTRDAVRKKLKRD